MYTTPNGNIKIEALFCDENIWLSQKKMAELFGVGVPAVNKHLKNIYESWELQENMTISKMETVVNRWFRWEVNEVVEFYNLDAIIAVWYRVNSLQATHFRIWATKILKGYLIKGFSIDDERLKSPNQPFGEDFFREMLERIRSIRTSERRVYQQITDIFAECCIDYDPKSEITQQFYAMIQNKFHYAITGKTAAEIVYEVVDSSKPKMGLQTRKNAPKGRILKSDVSVAKNYLSEKELKQLERAISGYFDYIERLIEKKTVLMMKDLAESVNNFLNFNKYEILEGKGKISRHQALQKAEKEYEIFNKHQLIESDFDRLVKYLQKS